MKTITRCVCSDGTQFADEHEANDHEIRLKIKEGMVEALSNHIGISPTYKALVSGFVARYHHMIATVVEKAIREVESPTEDRK
jgi:hypothetical protein